MSSCSPSMTSTATSGSEGKGKANEAAALNSKASNTSRSFHFHDVSLSSKASSTVRSCHDNISPLPQYPFDSSSTVQNPAKRNLPLTWTSEELQLVSKMRQGMVNTSRRKRSKKAKDAPKRPLSAYNIFFKEERQRIMSQEGLLSDSRVKKLGFKNLAKTIGARWKSMSSDEERASYKAKAARDSERYKNEMAAYREKNSAKAAPYQPSQKKTKR